MKKAIFIVVGILLALFGIAHVLQLLGILGTKSFSIAGVSAVILGLALSTACFKKALKQEE